MNGNILDTNIIIAVFAGEPSVLDKLSKREVFLSNIVIGELYFGAYKSTKVEQNITQIEQLVSIIPALNTSPTTAKLYGLIKSQLHKDGHPIPENDLWIAAQAMEYSLTLVTRDKHFKAIKDLLIEEW